MSMHPFGKFPFDVAGQSPETFTLSVPETDLTRFRALLDLSPIWPETWENKQGKFGITRDWLINAKRAWLDDFDWRRHEARINSFPNFKKVVKDVDVGDISIHFVALFSTKSDAVPVMFMHGWPGCFMEFLPMLELLINKYTPETLPYHIIVPSLPGYTLSSGPPLDKDFTLSDCARILNQLMKNLGFGKGGYIAQGGDVGYLLARHLAVTSEECKAIHLTKPVAVNLMEAPPTPPADAEPITATESEHLTKAKEWSATGIGYLIEHGTRPGTLSAVLSSSPLALLSWHRISEKYVEWADSREPIPLNTMLALVSLYWFTDTPSRSLWPYRFLAGLLSGATALAKVNMQKPLGYSYAPAEFWFLPKSWGVKLYPHMVRYDHETGGHFLALEQPKSFLADVEDFVMKNKELVQVNV